MTFNDKWPLWFNASINTHFKTIATGGLVMFLEGEHPRGTFPLTANFFELRVDGPYFTQNTKGHWRVFVEVNALVSSPMQLKDSVDLYSIHRTVGKVAAAFTDILVKTYGEVSLVTLGCLQLVQSVKDKEAIKISNFGQIEPSTRVQQSTVEAHYKMELA